MGIVSFCPNGHRTKLKDRYAGLRVRCPECGAKFWVAAGEPVAAAEQHPEPAATMPQPTSLSLPEPIAVAPEAAWCIALPGGEPSQPLPAAEMAAWLQSGAATGRELVWRSDWDNWRAIDVVFPESLGASE